MRRRAFLAAVGGAGALATPNVFTSLREVDRFAAAIAAAVRELA